MNEEKKWEIINYRKERSIAWFNSTNNAIAILAAYSAAMPKMKKVERIDFENSKANIIEWRDWFMSEWDKENPAPAEEDITIEEINEVKDF